MKLLLSFLLSLLIYHRFTGYPVVDVDALTENATSLKFWLGEYNKTAFNDTVTLDGFLKKIVDKVKDKGKDFNKFKDKIKDCKDLLKFITFSVAEEVPEDVLTENATTVEYWSNFSNESVFNGTSPLAMHGFHKVVDKVKDKIKNCKDILKVFTFSDIMKTSEDSSDSNYNETAIKDSAPLHGFGKKVVNKVKDGLNKVKDKIKDKYNKVKDKFKDIRDKIGSKGGSGGGSGSYKDNYDRDRYNRDRYDRDRYRKNSKSSGGSGSMDPVVVWFLVGFGILMFVVVVASVVYYKTKD